MAKPEIFHCECGGTKFISDSVSVQVDFKAAYINGDFIQCISCDAQYDIPDDGSDPQWLRDGDAGPGASPND